MKTKFLMILSILTFSQSGCLFGVVAEPRAEKIPTKLVKHGDSRIDNYFWLKERMSEKVLGHLKAENAYMADVLKDTKNLQENLYQEMRQRIKEEDQSVPSRYKNYFYYNKVQKGQEYSVEYRRKIVPDAHEEILLDKNQLAKDSDFIDVSSLEFHPDEQLFAYAVDLKGDRIFTINFKDQRTGQILDHKVENATSNFAWANTGHILFYVKMDPVTLRSNQLYRFDLDSGKTTLVFEEKDEKREIFVSKSLSGNYLFLSSESTLSSEVRMIPANEPMGTFKIFSAREKDHIYRVMDGGDRFYILTNWKARNFRIMEVNKGNTKKSQWKEVVAHRPDVLIEQLEVFKNYLISLEHTNGLGQIKVISRAQKNGEAKGDYILFPDPAYSVSFGTNAEYDSSFLRYDFSSMSQAYSVYDYNFETRESLLMKEKEVPGYHSKNYVSERVFAVAADGAQIPISIVYRKGTKKDGSAPLLVYGYGSYGINSDPYFSSTRVSLLDRGFIYAIIHVRGGSEMGRHWYEDGKFLKKKNTFTDFIAGTEFLVREKYAHPARVYANGGSAGGLLMGAIMNLRPELYKGIVAEVPFVDVVTTMLDSTLPLTTGEYEEWGNPNEKKYYDYMKSYSPYDNVKAMNYPNLLVTTGLNDSQVAYWEPAKWVAKLREFRLDKSKILIMKIEMEVGHGGKSGRFEYLRDEALSSAFILKLEGKK